MKVLKLVYVIFVPPHLSIMKTQAAKLKPFVEEVAMTCEQVFGFPRMAGRIWAVLLISEREYFSSEELMTQVGASRGTVSTMSRMLETIGLIKRVTVKGDRKHYYRAADSQSLIDAEIGSIKIFIQLMERGLKSVDTTNRTSRKRLTELHDLMSFFAAEYAALLERWYNQKEKK